MIELLRSGRRIINIDESFVNQTQYHRRMWAPPGAPASSTLKLVNPRLALLAALDTDGRVFFSLTHANTDTDIMIMFISCLCRKLDSEIVDWKSNSVFLLDGAKYHTSAESLKFLRLLGVQVIFSGPYSYCKFLVLLLNFLFITATAPIELLFGSFKFANLCDTHQKCGKK